MLTETSSSATKSPYVLVTLLTLMLMGSPLRRRRGRAEEGHDDQAGDRDQHEEERDGVRPGLVEPLVVGLDGEGGGLGLPGQVAGHDLDRAELTDGPGGGEDDAVHDRPLDAR